MKLPCSLTFSILYAYYRCRSALILHQSVKKIHGGHNFTPASVVFGSKPDKETPQISTTPGLPIVHHDGYESYLPPDHRFQMRKFNKLKGGTILAAELALLRGLVCSTGGGTHHAFPDHGAGFCLLNDMAVAARLMVQRGKVDRVLIIDLDVHQGDGTALIFQEDPSVFTLSVHCGKNYPVKKQQSDLDVSVDPGTGDDDYLRIIQDHIPSVLSSVRPGLVFFDAGVDPHEDDALGHLELTDQGLFRRDHWVINEVIGRGIPSVTVIGGGYDKDVDKLAARHSIVHRAAKKVWQERSL